MVEPVRVTLKESTVLIVEELLQQEDIAFEPEVTPTAVKPQIPIIEEPLTKENVALGAETTPQCWS